jgi:hypothetical protein
MFGGPCYAHTKIMVSKGESSPNDPFSGWWIILIQPEPNATLICHMTHLLSLHLPLSLLCLAMRITSFRPWIVASERKGNRIQRNMLFLW